jgi:hypothetical protein
MSRKMPAAALAGAPTVMGRPLSPPARISGMSGTCPEHGAELLGHGDAAAGAEEFVALAGGIDEVAHVLRDAEERDVDF